MKRSNGLIFCMAYYVAVLILGLGYAFFTDPADYAYDLTMLWGPLAMVVATLSLWLLAKRARCARWFAVVGTIACSAIAWCDLAWLGAHYILVDQMGPAVANGLIAAGFAGAAAVVCYLAFSKKARAELDQPLDMRPTADSGHSWDTPLRERVRTRVFWRDLVIYFTSFSFMGHWAEMLFCMGIVWGIFDGMYNFEEVMLWHQWLFPYMAEAIAMVLVVVLLHPFKQWLLDKMGGRVLPTLLLSIVITAVVCTTIDFTSGMICNQDYSVWDYRDMPFNFMGQVCLQNSCVYTVACTLLVWVAYPLLDRALRRMPRDVADGLCLALVAVFAFCALLHFVYVNDAGHLSLGMVMLPEQGT